MQSRGQRGDKAHGKRLRASPGGRHLEVSSDRFLATKCQFCGKECYSMWATSEHEATCIKNPIPANQRKENKSSKKKKK
jgi:hypothetical protein